MSLIVRQSYSSLGPPRWHCGHDKRPGWCSTVRPRRSPKGEASRPSFSTTDLTILWRHTIGARATHKPCRTPTTWRSTSSTPERSFTWASVRALRHATSEGFILSWVLAWSPVPSSVEEHNRPKSDDAVQRRVGSVTTGVICSQLSDKSRLADLRYAFGQSAIAPRSSPKTRQFRHQVCRCRCSAGTAT
jgi:hypothetical protein